MNVPSQDDLEQALTGFRATIRGPSALRVTGELLETKTVAAALHATLSRIAAEKAPDEDPPADAAVTAVMDVLAPVAGVDPDLAGMIGKPVRLPVFLIPTEYAPAYPSDVQVRALAEQIVTAIRASARSHT